MEFDSANSKFIILDVSQWTDSIRSNLKKFIKEHPNSTPYHNLAYAQVIKENFNYPDFSMIALDSKNQILGFLPQWKNGQILDSVPWRDRGGPLVSSQEVIAFFVEASKKIIQRNKMKGFLWKDFQFDGLQPYSYFIKTEIDLQIPDYWEQLDSATRGKIRAAEKHGLLIQWESRPSEEKMGQFYNLFLETRHRLGVPVYGPELFSSFFKNYPESLITMASVWLGNKMLGALVLLKQGERAIDAFAATSLDAANYKATDYLIFKSLEKMKQDNIRFFDFGSDSPVQTSLLEYKRKWLGRSGQCGKQFKILSSSFGSCAESDHNLPPQSWSKPILRRIPKAIYQEISKWVVR